MLIMCSIFRASRPRSCRRSARSKAPQVPVGWSAAQERGVTDKAIRSATSYPATIARIIALPLLPRARHRECSRHDDASALDGARA